MRGGRENEVAVKSSSWYVKKKKRVVLVGLNVVYALSGEVGRVALPRVAENDAEKKGEKTRKKWKKKVVVAEVVVEEGEGKERSE